MEQAGEEIPPNEIKNMKMICKLIKKKTEKKEKKETMTEMNYIPIPIDSIGIKFYGASENPDKPLRRNKVLEAALPFASDRPHLQRPPTFEGWRQPLHCVTGGRPTRIARGGAPPKPSAARARTRSLGAAGSSGPPGGVPPANFG